jgi:hypothetical protein
MLIIGICYFFNDDATLKYNPHFLICTNGFDF